MDLKNEKLLDAIGWKIIRELQLNGRLSYVDLSRAVSLSTPAVIERVRKMEEAGLITGYVAQVNPAALGFPITAFIKMNVIGNVSNTITKIIREMPEVHECHRATGSDSFIIKVNVRSIERLEKLIDMLTPFGTTTTSVVLSSPVLNQIIKNPPFNQ